MINNNITNFDKLKPIENYISIKNNYVDEDNLKIKNIFPEKKNDEVILRIEYSIWNEFMLKEYITEKDYKIISRNHEIEQILK